MGLVVPSGQCQEEPDKAAGKAAPGKTPWTFTIFGIREKIPMWINQMGPLTC